MNAVPVFRPHATRDYSAAPGKQFSRFKRWLYRVFRRPLIVSPMRAAD